MINPVDFDIPFEPNARDVAPIECMTHLFRFVILYPWLSNEGCLPTGLWDFLLGSDHMKYVIMGI
jgi:hypothetical protein